MPEPPILKFTGCIRANFPLCPICPKASNFPCRPQPKEFLSRSAFAAARDDSRQVSTAFYLRNTSQTATFIGTDGKRLAKIHARVDLPHDSNGSYIIPLKAVEEMVRMLDVKKRSLRKSR